jgi:hypothetical protein
MLFMLSVYLNPCPLHLHLHSFSLTFVRLVLVFMLVIAAVFYYFPLFASAPRRQSSILFAHCFSYKLEGEAREERG